MGRRPQGWPALLAALCVLLVASTAWAITVPPRPDRGVSDGAGVLTAEQRDALEKKLVGFHDEHGPSIAVALVPSLEGENIKEASYQIASTWKVGNAGRSDGVLFLVGVEEARRAGPGAKKCGCIRIEVGSYLEGDLTDSDSGKILKKAGPLVVEGNFNEAVNVAVDGIMAEVTPRAESTAGAPSSGDATAAGWILGILGAIFGVGIIAFIFSESRSRPYSTDDVRDSYAPPPVPPSPSPTWTTSSTRKTTTRKTTTRRTTSSSYVPPPPAPSPRRSSSYDEDDSYSRSSSWSSGDSGGGSLDFGGDFGGGGDDW